MSETLSSRYTDAQEPRAQLERIPMDFEALSKDERIDALAKIADLYYNQHLTQIEIARQFDTTRFKVAKLLQDASDEHIVEISINYSSERNHALERALLETFDLDNVIVADTTYATFIDGLRELGHLGATRLMELLVARPTTTLGITWGKSIQAVIEQLPHIASHTISTVQMAGNFDSSRPTSESRELVRAAAATCLGTAYSLNTPLYIQDSSTREALKREPDIKRTLDSAAALDIVLTGVGATASLPSNNPAFIPYLTKSDRDALAISPGSLYGYVLDSTGAQANVELNQRVMAVPLTDTLLAPHRLCVVHGRNKAHVAMLVAHTKLINELITDTETATLILKEFQNLS